MIVGYVPDLMDRSRLPAPIAWVASVDGLPASAAGADAVVVDLGRPGALEVAAALAASGHRVLGFTNHTDGATIDAAVDAGVVAMPRSLFFRRAAELLGGAQRG